MLRPTSRKLAFALAAILAAVGVVSVSQFFDRNLDVAGQQQLRLDLATAACSAPMAIRAPAADLASVVASQPAGTCFVLANGTYRFHDVVPKNNMVFLGESTNGVVVDGRGHENAFHGTADRVTIARMTFDRFDNSAGTTRQEQSPIRGTARIWASDRGHMATNWLIEEIVSSNNYAAGLFMGEHFTVRNSTFKNNGVTGISGDDIVGGLIEGNIVFGNGANQASGALVNGGGMKFGQTGTPAEPLVIRNNEVYDNPKIGIWCDIGCDGFHVIDNYIHDHISRGVMIELSSNAVIRGNTVLNSNTWTGFRNDFNAGAITIGESRNSLVENNLVDGAKAGVVVRQTKRPASGESFLTRYRYVNYLSNEVTVRNNVIRNTDQMGISTGSSGANLIPDPNTIRFTGNTYDNPANMTFWWNNGQQMTFAQWQAAGRDTTANGSVSGTSGGDRGPQGGSTPAPPTTQAPAAQPPTTGPPVGQNVPATPTASVPLRINAGGPAHTDLNGVKWIADTYFTGGYTASHASGIDIRGTAQDVLYRQERWGRASYEIPLSNGQYVLRLHHAEVFDGCQAVGCRRFTVQVEGRSVFADLDLFGTAGGYTAHMVETQVSVTDGSLSIGLSSSLQNPQISGIEVLAATSHNGVSTTQPSTSGTAGGSGSPSTTSGESTTSGSVSDGVAVGADLGSNEPADAEAETGDASDGDNHPVTDTQTNGDAGTGSVEAGGTDDEAPDELAFVGDLGSEDDDRLIVIVLSATTGSVIAGGFGLKYLLSLLRR